ncbi:MAG: ATP-binding protein [Acidobacteriota bacterium]
MAKTRGDASARPGRRTGRPSTTTWIELLQEPAALVDSRGHLLHFNTPFRSLLCGVRAGDQPAPGDPLSEWLSMEPPLELPLDPVAGGCEARRARAGGEEWEVRLGTVPEKGGTTWLLGLRPCRSLETGRDLALLQEMGQTLAYTLEPEEVFRRLLDLMGRALDFDIGACAWSGEAVVTGLIRLEVPAEPAALQREIEMLAREFGVPWSPRPVFSIERSLSYRHRERTLEAAPDFRLAAPLHCRGAVCGLLWLASSSPSLAREENRRLLLGMANQASLTLERLETTQAAESHRLQAVIDSMPAGIFLLDASGRARLLNPAARTLLQEMGIAPGAALRLLGGIDLMPMIAGVVRGGRALPAREVEDGGRVLRLSLTRVRSATAQEPAVLLVAEDVTEQRRIREQLMQSEKLSSLGEMISGVAHELNNPLATVMGYAQLLMEAPVSGDIRRMLEAVNSESGRCQKIVQNLLTFARRHPPERRRVDVGALVRSVTELLEYGSRSEGVQVECDVEKDLPIVLGDPHQLQQVFLNILNNAFQALEAVAGQRRVRISVRREGHGVRLEFSDNGPGIAPEAQSRLFDPFFTTKPTGKGTGLGLSLAFGIVRQHGGTIEARNLPRRGACFSVWLPVVGGSAEAASAEPGAVFSVPAARKRAPAQKPLAEGTHGPRRGAGTATRRILVVDDEQFLAAVMREALEADGFGVEVARDGEEALRCLDATPFDLVITDLKMPNMNGWDLHARILEREPRLAGRVLFSTGDVVNPTTLRFFEETRSPYITKPFKLSELRRLVHSLLESPGAGA